MENKVYELARKRVKKKKGFYGHFSAFLATAIFFFLMNVATYSESGEWWFFFSDTSLEYWPDDSLLWCFLVLPGTDIMTKDWEEREIEREAKRIRNRLEPLPDLNEDELELRKIEREKAKNDNWEDEDLV